MLYALVCRGESFYNPYLASTVQKLLDSSIAVREEGSKTAIVPVEGFEFPLIIQKKDGA